MFLWLIPADRSLRQWFVRVVDGNEELTRSFELDSFALAYAEGQRRRLGLPVSDRL